MRKKPDYTGAIVVLENYLDGAIADYENGDVDNDCVIMSCIDALKRLESHCWVNDYEERMRAAKEKRGIKDEEDD